MNQGAIESFALTLAIQIRRCQAEDLSNLDWFGLLADHREMVQMAYERQLRGENVMLMADLSGLPVGQVWIDLVRKKQEAAGVIWALRVLPWLRNRGLGRRLVAAAETQILAHGLALAEVGVELNNPNARRLYERLGYQGTRRAREEYVLINNQGQPIPMCADLWLMRKELAPLVPELKTPQEAC